ncbi:MAG: dagA [Chlamydiales bacterium]|jgi:AGCS family alanine or glycine:cation symporter|nr:dagA [Chlamydiales bacterium]
MDIDSFSLEAIENLLWNYLAFPILLSTGLYFSIKSGFGQILNFPKVLTIFWRLLSTRDRKSNHVHPINAFFACIGGCVGIGNVISVSTAIQIGGPGAIFWIWVTAIMGSLVKYSEVYLGIKYRELSLDGTYSGGPMYYLKAAFQNNWLPRIVAFFLIIYSVEVYQFRLVACIVSETFGFDKTLVVVTLIAMVLWAALGGVRRVGKISSTLIPVFVFLYIVMGSYVLYQYRASLSALLHLILSSAFSGHAALGGFAGSTLLFTMSQGIRRGSYSGDIGVGYASIIHSESREVHPEVQASLTLFEIFLDSIVICTLSALLVLASGTWTTELDPTLLVQHAMADFFPYMDIFFAFFFFLLGYSTIIAYFTVGLKCAKFLNARYGIYLYVIYAAIALFIFAFKDNSQAFALMASVNALLLILNISGILRLRKEISFHFN